MKQKKRSWAAALFACAALPCASFAEPVSVNNGEGNGFLFSYRGNCYLFLPQHVHGRSLNVTIATAAPPAIGDAVVFQRFMPGADLSIAYVKPGMEQRCRDSWSDLPDRADEVLDQSGSATLIRVFPSGLVERAPMEITFRSYDHVEARPVEGEVYQGVSGSILEAGGVVVGMAVRSKSVDHAEFLRVDEIKSRIFRLLDARAAGVEYARSSEAPANQPSSSCAAGSSLPILSVTCSHEPISPDYACSNLAKGGAARFPALDKPLDIYLELETDAAVPLSSVVLGKNPEALDAASPKAIRIEIDASSGQSRRWRRFASGDMTPLGEFAGRNGSKPFARRIKVSVDTSWDPTLPLQVDCLAATGS